MVGDLVVGSGQTKIAVLNLIVIYVAKIQNYGRC